MPEVEEEVGDASEGSLVSAAPAASEHAAVEAAAEQGEGFRCTFLKKKKNQNSLPAADYKPECCVVTLGQTELDTEDMEIGLQVSR